MPVEIEHLNRILKKLKLKHKNNTIILTEKGKQAILKEIHLTDIHNDYLSLKADDSNFQIFAKGFASKQCDYIVLSEHNGVVK